MLAIGTGFVIYIVFDTIAKALFSKKQATVRITSLTDFELKPIEEQDMNYEDAVEYFNSHRAALSARSNNSQIQTARNTIINSHRVLAS